MLTPFEQVERSYAAAVERILAGQPGAGALLRRVSTADPGFALAHAGLALLHHRAGRPEAAGRRLERAAGAAGGASRRVRSHVEVLAGLIEGPPGPAQKARRWPACGRTWPCSPGTPCWCRRGPSC